MPITAQELQNNMPGATQHSCECNDRWPYYVGLW